MNHLSYIYIYPEFQLSHPEAPVKPFKVITALANTLHISLVFIISISVESRRKTQNENEKYQILLKEKSDTELKFLKSQINPHFLFNALNNIYTLTYMKSPRAPEHILKLSDMLRYVIYDCSEHTVSLEKEINYISNYIDFHRIKFDNDKNIRFDISIEKEGQEIDPMLMIPIIENCFKHGDIENNPDGFIYFNIATINKKLVFTASNSYTESKSTSSTLKKGGIGIENVQQRLARLYPNKSQLNITQENKVYKTRLEIELS